MTDTNPNILGLLILVAVVIFIASKTDPESKVTQAAQKIVAVAGGLAAAAWAAIQSGIGQ